MHKSLQNTYKGMRYPIASHRQADLSAWCMQKYVVGQNAETMQAVPNMLELVPKGVNKGSGMRKLLANLDLPVEV